MDRIEAFLSAPIIAVRSNADRRGCFLCNAAADRASLDTDTETLVLRGYAKMRGAIAGALNEAFPDAEAATITQRAQLILTVYSGLRVMSRSGIKGDDLEMAKTAVLDMMK